MRVCRNWRKQSIRRQHDASRWCTGAWHGHAHSRCLVPGMEETMNIAASIVQMVYNVLEKLNLKAGKAQAEQAKEQQQRIDDNVRKLEEANE